MQGQCVTRLVTCCGMFCTIGAGERRLSRTFRWGKKGVYPSDGGIVCAARHAHQSRKRGMAASYQGLTDSTATGCLLSGAITAV